MQERHVGEFYLLNSNHKEEQMKLIGVLKTVLSSESQLTHQSPTESVENCYEVMRGADAFIGITSQTPDPFSIMELGVLLYGYRRPGLLLSDPSQIPSIYPMNHPLIHVLDPEQPRFSQDLRIWLGAIPRIAKRFRAKVEDPQSRYKNIFIE